MTVTFCNEYVKEAGGFGRPENDSMGHWVTMPPVSNPDRASHAVSPPSPAFALGGGIANDVIVRLVTTRRINVSFFTIVSPFTASGALALTWQSAGCAGHARGWASVSRTSSASSASGRSLPPTGQTALPRRASVSVPSQMFSSSFPLLMDATGYLPPPSLVPFDGTPSC